MITKYHTNQSENSVQLLDEMSNADFINYLIANNDLFTEINEIEVERTYDVNINTCNTYQASKSKYSLNLENVEKLVDELEDSFNSDEDHNDVYNELTDFIDSYELSLEHSDYETNVTKTDFSRVELNDAKTLVNIWLELEQKFNKKYVLTDYQIFKKNHYGQVVWKNTRVLLNEQYFDHFRTFDNNLTLDEFIEKNKSVLN